MKRYTDAESRSILSTRGDEDKVRSRLTLRRKNAGRHLLDQCLPAELTCGLVSAFFDKAVVWAAVRGKAGFSTRLRWADQTLQSGWCSSAASGGETDPTALEMAVVLLPELWSLFR